jgi:transposase, IS5 family
MDAEGCRQLSIVAGEAKRFSTRDHRRTDVTFNWAHRSLRKLKTYLGRVIRHIERRIVGKEDLQEAFVRPLYLARRALAQERRQRGRKVYFLHAPEVECIGKGKAHRPYEFGVKVSVATTG